MYSVNDMFKIGLGPSSSHTTGPMRIAKKAIQGAQAKGLMGKIHSIVIELQGSLALTGIGHGSDKASILGLMGFDPETISSQDAHICVQQVHEF